jgi:hypothetical protein
MYQSTSDTKVYRGGWLVNCNSALFFCYGIYLSPRKITKRHFVEIRKTAEKEGAKAYAEPPRMLFSPYSAVKASEKQSSIHVKTAEKGDTEAYAESSAHASFSLFSAVNALKTQTI